MTFRYQISMHEECDKIAANSHCAAIRARDAGRFRTHVVPVETSEGLVSEDNSISDNTNVEQLAKLSPIYDYNLSGVGELKTEIRLGPALTIPALLEKMDLALLI